MCGFLQIVFFFFFFQAEDGIRDKLVTGVQTCALPIWALGTSGNFSAVATRAPFRLLITPTGVDKRSEEHTSELQSLAYLVCRLLLEKKNKRNRESVCGVETCTVRLVALE